MSFGAILSYLFGILGPAAIAAACVFEFLARRLSKNPRGDKARLERLRHYADIGLVAAWLLLAAAYLSFQNLAPDAEALADGFQRWMTWMLGLLVVFDILYLYLRRSRPRRPGARKHFWEI